MTLETMFYMHSARPLIERMLSKGMKLHHACGPLASIQGECSFNASAVGDKNPHTGVYAAHGEFQIHADRIAAIKQGCGIDMLTADAVTQIDGMWWELNHTEKHARDVLFACANAYDSGYAFAQHYERPANISKEGPRRARWSQDWFDALKGLYPAT